MKIKDLPSQNRPRERFLKYGAEALSDAELFAILLRTGTKQEKIDDLLVSCFSRSNKGRK